MDEFFIEILHNAKINVIADRRNKREELVFLVILTNVIEYPDNSIILYQQT